MPMNYIATGTTMCAYPRCDAFIDALSRAGIVHVQVARAIDRGTETLGVLVADEDVAQVYDLAGGTRGLSVKCFTSDGSLQGSFRIPDANYSAITLAVFPIYTAEALLSEAGSPGRLVCRTALPDSRLCRRLFRRSGPALGRNEGTRRARRRIVRSGPGGRAGPRTLRKPWATGCLSGPVGPAPAGGHAGTARTGRQVDP